MPAEIERFGFGEATNRRRAARLDETLAALGLAAKGAPGDLEQAMRGLLTQAGYDLSEIQFIEGLLFLSMLPLHVESPDRQKMMFLTGLGLMNDVLA